MKNIAIIPARGGSKGIPDKNLSLVGGLSLIARTVRAALQSQLLDAVYVTSDSPRIQEEAAAFGANVLMRAPATATDTASSESALLDALARLQSEGIVPDEVTFLQCTSPFVTAEDIDGTIRARREGGAECALTVMHFHGFLWREAGEQGLVGVGHDASFRPRRQDRETQFLETGGVYVMDRAGFEASGHRFFGKVAHYEVPADRAMEIDEFHDLEIANLLARRTGFELSESMAARLGNLQAVLLDFDGVLTDNAVLVDETGREAVRVSRSDGMGISALKAAGCRVYVVSKERNPVVEQRCRKLDIPCFQAVDDKAGILMRLQEREGVDLARSVFVGNDVNDLPAFGLAGVTAAPADAHPDVLARAELILPVVGGHGAVRFLSDLILKARNG